MQTVPAPVCLSCKA